MRFSGGNKAIRDRAKDGKEIAYGFKSFPFIGCGTGGIYKSSGAMGYNRSSHFAVNNR